MNEQPKESAETLGSDTANQSQLGRQLDATSAAYYAAIARASEAEDRITAAIIEVEQIMFVEAEGSPAFRLAEAALTALIVPCQPHPQDATEGEERAEVAE